MECCNIFQVKQLQKEAANAKSEIESAEVNRLTNDLAGMEDQLAERNKVHITLPK